MLDPISYLQELIRRPSLTPDDQGCQLQLKQTLIELGFRCEDLPFGNTQNLWARWGTQNPLFVFAGHTDVVPTGPRDAWHYDPFAATIDNGILYGRGAADMKSGIVAMLYACCRLLQQTATLNGSIAFLITSDEEGPSLDGTRRVVEVLKARGELPDYCLVGEASSVSRLGDTLKIGRRGSLCGQLIVHGKQGHIAYPQLADNPIHRLAPTLAELCAMTWDAGTDDFAPTSFQCSNIHAGTGADNVIAGSLQLDFNFRYSPASNAEQLQTRLEHILQQHQLNYTITWRHSGEPFYSQKAKLVQVCQTVIEEHCGITPVLSTGGGTSDGRFIAKICPEVIELGPNNASIHKIDECIATAELLQLSDLYLGILQRLLL
jgi:succinyl-diaminopimelate desuccinylase